MTSNTGHETQRAEPHQITGLAQRLNWLRAGVLGANDGIVSTAAVVVGVASATNQFTPVLLAGAAAVVGGAISMALGEYVSVSSQRDSENALIEKEREELREDPEGELEELVGLYEEQGLSRGTAEQVAKEMTERDALKAHLSLELNISEDDVVNPWQAALASALSFFVGAILPMLTILFLPTTLNIPVTFAATIVALGVTGSVAAWIGGANRLRAIVRTCIGGVIALAATFLVGMLFGTTVL
jgi:VIT1/CCC1 family predicted Fe2+/Mn2+ transporter